MTSKESTDRAPSLPGFGRFLRKLRVDAEMSGSQFAKLSGCSQSAYAKYELGVVADPDLAVLKAIAEHAGVLYEDMVRELVAEKYGVRFQGASLDDESANRREIVLDGNAQVVISISVKTR